jgi:hypothetical protein
VIAAKYEDGAKKVSWAPGTKSKEINVVFETSLIIWSERLRKVTLTPESAC